MAEPEFIPRPGQVDYTNIRYAPVVNTVVTHDGKFLLVQRSPDMRLYPGYWNGVSGFLDDTRSIEDKVHQELREELSIPTSAIESLERGAALVQEAPEYNKTWLVVPVLARVATASFELDWEAQRAEWYKPEDIAALRLMPGFSEVIAQFIEKV